MKTIGIIGGFSPEATAQFYLELIRLNRKKRGKQPRCIMWNCAVSQKEEEILLKNAKHPFHVRQLLIQSARALEAAGADVIVLPCNTLHIFAPVIKRSVTIPFISIVDTMRTHLIKKGITSAGLLGSGITINSSLFASTSSLQFIKPKKTLQLRINTALHKAVKTGKTTDLTSALSVGLTHFSQQGITDVVLACTDFAAVCPEPKGIRLHDTLSLLAHETIENI